MSNVQGETQSPASAPLEGVPVETSAAPVDASIQQFIVDPNPSAATQGGEGQPQNTAPEGEQARHFQQIADRERAEKLALQNQLAQITQAMVNQQQQPQQVQEQPPDPNQNWAAWLDWKLRQNQKETVSQLQQQNTQWLQNIVSQAQEQQLQQKYPNLNMNQVKQFAQFRGIANLEDAITLMTLPQTTADLTQTIQQQTIKTLSQPQMQARPIRTANSATPPQQEVNLSYEQMLKAYTANPSIADSWPPDLEKKFWRETLQRANS